MTATIYTLRRLPDGTGAVIATDGHTGPVIGGQAGFSIEDVAEAIRLHEDGESAELADWHHLTLTQESAEFVAASYPAVVRE